jgi:hypothetical protein
MTLRFRLLAGLALASLISCAAFSADPPAPVKTPPPKTDLHRLDNKALLAQATALLQKASCAYLAQLRELVTLERSLERARKRSEEVKVPPPPANGADNRPSPLEVARKSAEQSRARRDALKRLRERLAVEKKLLDTLARCVETSRSAALAFLGTLDELQSYQLEIDLRVQDKTLAQDTVAEVLSPAQTTKQRKHVQTQQTELASKTDTVRTALEQIAKRLTQTDSDVLEAETALVQASSRADREQKRQQMEKTFEARRPAELLKELTSLIEEEPGLKGAFQLSLQRVEQQQGKWERLGEALAKVKVPASRLPDQVRPEEVAAAVKSAAALLASVDKRIKALGEVREAIAVLNGRVSEFEADAAVLGEHLFKMQVLSRVLRQKGNPDAKSKVPAEADALRLNKAAASGAKAVAGVQAEQQKARKEDGELQKELLALTATRTETQTRLTALKQAEEATLATVTHEARLSKMSARDAVDSFTKTAADLKEALTKLDPEKVAYRKALSAVTELQTKRDALKDPFVREAEDLVLPQRQKILAELRKEAAINGNNGKPPAQPPVAAPPAKKKEDPPKGAATPAPAVVPPPPSRIEKLLVPMRAFQQRIGSRDRVVEESEQLKKELLTALAELQKQIEAYAKVLNHARHLARQGYTTAVNLKKRVGREELAGKDLPAGITEALQPALLKRLDDDSTELLGARTQAAAQVAALNQVDKPLAQADGLRKQILELVGQRIDLLTELEKLEANYALDRKDRPPLEVKRQQQRASELLDDESTWIESLLRIDTSRAALSLQELLDGYYLELIEIRDKDEVLEQEKGMADRLLELTTKEAAALKKMLPVLEKIAAGLMTTYEEELILVRARLRPDLADDLLKKYQARTGRTLPRPPPLTEKEKSEKIDDLGGQVLERLAQAEAMKRYAALLQERLSPTGLKKETSAYQEESARIKAASDANRRRVTALTGKEAPDGGKGDIGRVRRELQRVRQENALWIMGKIGLILLGALLVPRFILWMLTRVFGKGDPDNDSLGLLISSLRAFVRAIVWLVALALILHVLGFDITALLAGLGIGGLAIGLAAKDMIADIISALVIFLERRFKIGDVLRFGQDREPAKVVGLNWRMTQLKGADGLTFNVPNRMVTNRRIQNLTRQGKTHDSLDVMVTTAEEVQPVLQAIREVIEQNPDLGPASERGYCIETVEHKEGREWRDRPSSRFKVVSYRFWWQIRDFEDRNRIRDEVLMQISQRLSAEDLNETQVVLK